MSLRATDLSYPVLCVTREMGVCVAGNPSDLRRCNAAVFRRGEFFEGLRVVNSGGATYEGVRARIRRPATAGGQRVGPPLRLRPPVGVALWTHGFGFPAGVGS